MGWLFNVIVVLCYFGLLVCGGLFWFVSLFYVCCFVCGYGLAFSLVCVGLVVDYLFEVSGWWGLFELNLLLVR